MKRLTKIMVMLVAVSFLAVATGTAYADAISPGSTWYEFKFGDQGSWATSGSGTVPSSGGNSVQVGDPPWTFTVGSGYSLTVTDAFQYGDSFSIYDFGTLLFSTPSVTATSGSISDPELALLDLYSHASMFLAAGDHSITILTDASPWGGGAAYFKVDQSSVPEPSTMLLLGAGLAGLAFLRRKRA